jgi:hypothetical protein
VGKEAFSPYFEKWGQNCVLPPPTFRKTFRSRRIFSMDTINVWSNKTTFQISFLVKAKV